MRPAILSFYSYKGGVGRTLLAANMAVAFARQGKTLLCGTWMWKRRGCITSRPCDRRRDRSSPAFSIG